MKIALVSPYDYPYAGGVQEHIYHLAEESRRLGHQVKVIAPSSSDVEELAREDIYKVGSVVRIPSNGSVARLTLSLRLSGHIKRILREEDFDVIHLHEPLLPALPITVLRHSQALNIGTFHAYAGSNICYFYGKPVLRRFFNKLDGRIAVSGSAQRFVSRYFPGDYTVIPNGIDLDRFGATVKPLPQFDDGKLNILFVGRLEKRKGFAYLLRAFPTVKRAVPQARLIIVGAYSEKIKRRYASIVEQRGLRDVCFVGYAAPEELGRYYKSCHVFCAPSIGGESFGIVLLEAMAASRPIVASDIEGYSLLVDHGQQGILVPPKDPEALAMALIRLLGDTATREEMGQKGFLRAQDYSWEKIAHRVLAYYGWAARRSGVGALWPVEAPMGPSSSSTVNKGLAG